MSYTHSWEHGEHIIFLNNSLIQERHTSQLLECSLKCFSDSLSRFKLYRQFVQLFTVIITDQFVSLFRQVETYILESNNYVCKSRDKKMTLDIFEVGSTGLKLFRYLKR